jgi:hypothetical protein
LASSSCFVTGLFSRPKSTFGTDEKVSTIVVGVVGTMRRWKQAEDEWL